MPQLCHTAIRERGEIPAVSLEGLDRATIEKLHRFMLRLRRCEQALIDEYHKADEMRCPVHFCVGQEAAPAAVSALLKPNDYLFSHHRTHGYYLAKGAPMREFFAELFGRRTGANGGKAGSQDISWPDARFYGGAILGGATAIATGAALAIQLQQRDEVVVAGFGEACTEEGIIWETLNYAALRKLPIVFICENNIYSIFSPQLRRQPADNIHERVATFGVPSCAVFGNDAAGLYRTLSRAIDGARQGNGPYFIEAYTYRWCGHVGPEDDSPVGYREFAEIDFWKERCPIELFEKALREAGIFDAGARQALVAEIDAEIRGAFEFARSSPFPDEPDWEAANYAAESPLADALLQDVSAGAFNQYQSEALPGPY